MKDLRQEHRIVGKILQKTESIPSKEVNYISMQSVILLGQTADMIKNGLMMKKSRIAFCITTWVD